MSFLKLTKLPKIRNITNLTLQSRRFCKDKSEDDITKDNKANEKEENVKVDSAAERLNKLLASMKTADEKLKLKKSASIPKAGRRIQIISQQETEKIKLKQKSKDIVQAAKDVASLMGEDRKKTESELLSKLLNHIDDTSDPVALESKQKSNELNLKDIIVGMKIDRGSERTEDQSRAKYVRNVFSGRQAKQRQLPENQQYKDKSEFRRKGLLDSHSISGSVNLFGEEPLGIFTNKDELKETPDCLKTWYMLEKRELNLAITHPPANYFEKMAVWTEQGKLWKFPIDNEQGLDEEAKVDFSEHVFLEQHLDSWCPTKGPVRHFMELVCVGLSKNPYITAQEKKEHILWYQDYFEQKKDILKATIIHQQDHEKGKEIQ